MQIGQKAMEKNKSKHRFSEQIKPEKLTNLHPKEANSKHKNDNDALSMAKSVARFIKELNIRKAELESQNKKLLIAQKELKNSQKRYCDLFNFAPVGYFTFDKNGVVIEANLTGCNLLQVEREELIGKPFDSFVEKESFKDFKRLLGLATIPGKKTHELRLVKKDGTIFEAQFESIGASETIGDRTICRTALTDITKRKYAEEKLKDYAEELKRSNRDLEQFAYIATHDLGEPLRAIKGFTELLCKITKGDPKATEYCKLAIEGAKRMEDMLAGLLHYSRVQTHGKAFSEISAEPALNAAVENLKQTIAESAAIITNDPLPVIKADGVQLTQLFQNLISNAIKFRGDSRPKIHISCRQEEKCHLFSVKDNGIGIDPQFKERIFFVFQRLHTTEKCPGYGIGLSICKRIVERHGGHIWVESQTGQGSTFYFTIPYNH